MKTTFQHNEYSEQELEKQFESEHKQILHESALCGEHFGPQNRPELTGDNLWGYVSHLFPKYQQMILIARQKIKPDSAVADAKMVTEAAEEKTKALTQKQRSAQTEISKMELNLKQRGIKLGEIPSKEYDKKFYLILAAIAVTEIIFNTTAFQLVGDNFLISLLISIGVTFSLLRLVQEIAQQLKEGNNGSILKKIALGGGVLVVLAAFYFLAKFRTEAIGEQTNTYIPPIAFVVLNVLFIIPAFVHFYRNAVSQPEKQKNEELKKLNEQMNELKKQEHELSIEIEQIKQETAKEVNRLLHKPAYMKWLTECIYAMQAEAIEAFKSANITARPDRKIPGYFNQPIAPPFQTVNEQ